MKRSTGSERHLLFVDTWGWIVLADAKDPAHEETVALRRRHSERGILVTSDYVLDETITRVFAAGPFIQAEAFCTGILESSRAGILRIEGITPERFQQAYRWRLRFRDKPRISFTDLTTFVVMKELGITDVLTADTHFEQVRLGFRRLP